MDVFGLPVSGPGIQFPPNLACLAQKSQGDAGIQTDFIANLFHRFDIVNLHRNSPTGNLENSGIDALALLQ
jgi:hypothetical protein